MYPRLLLALLLGAAVLISGCSQAPSTPAPAAATPAPAAATPAPAAATPAAPAATPAGTVKAGSSVDFAACVPGTPWEYAGASAAGGYTYTWKIEGKADYKGSGGWCKVVGKAQGAGVPAGYSFEYYFKGFDAAKGTPYTDLCYKINLGYAGAPPQEACIIQGGAPVTPGK